MQTTDVNMILETVNQGLKSLPPIASNAFEIMVKGTVTEGILSLIIDLIIISIFSLVLWFTYKFSQKDDIYKTNYSGGRDEMRGGYLTLIVTLVVISFIAIAISIFDIPFSIKSIFAPEYVVIKSFIYSLQ